MKCPSREDLERYHEGAAPAGEVALLRDHVSSCARCSGWVREATGDDDLLARLRAAVADAPDDAPDDAGAEVPADPALARYRILGRIGAGGIGIVYEAEQLRPRRLVALKILRPGAGSERTLRRFEIEAEVLGRLDHPNIARVHEAGSYVSEVGRHPFIAMERVDGTTLGSWLEAERPTVRARLEAFLEICDAVGHAHRNGVIHRDLKPHNVLMTADGRPKVVDFGVARLIGPRAPGPETEAGQFVGTLAYTSPEQLGGDPDEVDTRTDVYALGAVLYEMLVGRPLFELEGLGLKAAVERIGSAPRAVRPAGDLRGDLVVIVAKAVDLVPDRRYPSVDELAADLRRHLEKRPITARRAGALEVAWKFARRNRVLCGGALTTLVAIIVGLIGTTTQLQRARRAERLANRQLAEATVATRRAELVKSILQDVLRSANPSEAKGHDYTVVQALDDATLRLGSQLPDDPEIEADVRQTLGLAYSDLGEYDAAEQHLLRTLTIRHALAGADDDARVADVLLALANIAVRRGSPERCEELAAQSLAIYDRVGAGDDRRARALTTVGLGLYQSGHYAEADARLSEALALRQADSGEAPEDVANSLGHLGALRLREGRHDEARDYLERALALLEELGLEAGTTAIAVRRDLAALASNLGRHDEARGLYQRTIGALERLLGSDHPQLATPLIRLARARVQLGRLADAEEHFRRALATLDPRYANHSEYRAYTLVELSDVVRDQGRPDESTALLREALTAYEDVLGVGHESTLILRNKVWNRLRGRGEMTAANELYRTALSRLDELAQGERHAGVYTRYRLAIGLHRLHEHARAAPLFERVLASPLIETEDWRSNRTHACAYLARSRLELGELDAALVLARRAVELRDESFEPDNVVTLRYRALIGDVLVAQDRLEEALDVLEPCAATIARVVPGSWQEAVVRSSLAYCRGRLGDRDTAVEVLAPALERITASIGADSVSARSVERWLRALE